MANPRYLWLGLAAFGLATGFAIPKKGKSEAGTPVARDEARPTKTKRGGSADPASQAAIPTASLPVSKDSIEDLLALDDVDLYGRVGLWLLDASAEDMAAFWKAYHDKGNPNSWIKDLIFTQWAKKDIHGLLQAAKHYKEEGAAWWAWTMSDPDAALAAMEGQSEEIRSFTLRGIGNFHPKRALKMMEEDPSLARYFDMATLARELARNDPEAGLNFMAKHGSYDLGKALRKWAKDDPHRAFEWLSERGPDARLRKEFLDTVAQEDPEALAGLIAGMKSGATKREFETALFKNLTETNPEKALEDARKIEASPLAAQRLAEVGKAMVSEHPEQALDILREVFKTCPDATSRMRWTRYPNGGSGSGGGVPGVSDLIGELTRWNPQLVMESVQEMEVEGNDSLRPGRERTSSWYAATTWIKSDPTGFTAWCEQQDDATFNFGAATFSNHLSDQNDFTGAMEWAQRIKDPTQRVGALMSGISRWTSTDREAATQWYQKAELSDDVRSKLKGYFPTPAQ